MTTTLKREKARREELERIKERLKKDIPTLDKRQIRRHRIPYHEALCLELEEDGFTESASFIRSLIDFQENVRQEAGPESALWLKPKLINDRSMIEKLYYGLQAAEEGLKKGYIAAEVDKLLELGIFFSNQSEPWWWLAEQILLECVHSASTYTDDGSKREALSRYILGRFLLTQMYDANRASAELRKSREISAGQNWNAKDVLGIPQNNLFIESCSYLYKALLIIARETMDEDPLKAARMCAIAQKRALDANDQVGEAKCLMQLGLCEMRAGDANTALSRFNKVLMTNFSMKNGIGICDTRIELALAHSRIGNIKEANYQLESLLEYAEKNELKYYYGQAHRFLGELHLTHGNPHVATSLLIKALKIFHELDDYDNREQVKNLAAIAAGQELFPKYVELILSVDASKEGQLNLMKMVAWKDTREIFWEHEKSFDSIFTNKDDDLDSKRTEDEEAEKTIHDTNLDEIISDENQNISIEGKGSQKSHKSRHHEHEDDDGNVSLISAVTVSEVPEH